MRRIGFVTSAEDPTLTTDDLVMRAPLAARGCDVAPVIWDQFDASKLDAVILRSCWDYHRKPDAFRAWLRDLASLPIPVLNPPAISAWNLAKGYLFDLRARGVPIPETILVRQGERFVDALEHERVVVKPAISLDGHDTHLVSRQDADRVVRDLTRSRDVLVQEFMPEIETTGELSFVFLGGVYSHAIQKLPARGEFRVQVEYGGRRVRAQPSSDLIAQAERVLRTVPERLLFARVDAVERNGRLVLMELEIIDPMLFLAYADGAPERFADAILAML